MNCSRISGLTTLFHNFPTSLLGRLTTGTGAFSMNKASLIFLTLVFDSRVSIVVSFHIALTHCKFHKNTNDVLNHHIAVEMKVGFSFWDMKIS